MPAYSMYSENKNSISLIFVFLKQCLSLSKDLRNIFFQFDFRINIINLEELYMGRHSKGNKSLHSPNQKLDTASVYLGD